MTSITYPNGKVLTYNYSTGLNDTISRLSSLSDTSGTLESYSYLGLGTIVIRSHPQPGVDLTYVKQSGESNGDAGDQYTGLDRFGRVVDQRWIKTSSGTATDRFQYGYDRDSNRLWRDNLVNSAFGEMYSYDNLNQITSFDRGTLNGTKDGLTGTASRSQDWNFDALGNFDSVTTDGSTQTRSHNDQNEITSISGATTPTYDANGNMTGDETGRKFVYDAWNRLVTVKDSGNNVLESFAYDGVNRRVSTTASSTTTDLYYSAEWQVLEERVGGNTTMQYVWSPVYVDAMIERDRDTDSNGTLDERLYVQQDANWNVTAVVSTSGSVLEREIYDPYGVATFLNASWSTLSGSAYAWIYLHQGGRFEATSGLCNFRNREYSSVLGRWLQNDPGGYSASDLDLYRYVENNSVRAIDPYGLKVTDFTVEEVEKPITKAWMAYFWPVNYKLNDKADACDGGWVVQHIVTKVEDVNAGKDLFNYDYWEGFRVEPSETGPRPSEGSKDLIDYFKKGGIDISGIKFTDQFGWVSGEKKPLNVSTVGKVYYIDKLRSLPATWVTTYAPAAGLPAIETTGNEKEIEKFLKDNAGTTIGPKDHILKLASAKDGTTTVVSKTP